MKFAASLSQFQSIKNQKTKMKVRVYLDLLQYSQEEQRQIAMHNKGKGGSGQILRNLDEEPQWHANFVIQKQNQVYETHMFYDEQA
jgi:hypothetical protein